MYSRPTDGSTRGRPSASSPIIHSSYFGPVLYRHRAAVWRTPANANLPTQPSRRPDARESHHPCMTWFPAFDITVVSCPASSLPLLQRPLIGQGNPAPPPRVSLPSQSPRGTIHPFVSVLSLVTSHTRLTSAKANGANHDQPTVDSRHWKKQPAIHPTTGLCFFQSGLATKHQQERKKKTRVSTTQATATTPRLAPDTAH
jgi:hypothetical protein